jgi:hypothetical protein
MSEAFDNSTVRGNVPHGPDHVTIVGLGPSCAAFFELTRRLGGISAYCDEVWGINAIGDVLRCDRIFHMDDLKVQEARAEARPDSNIAAMVRWLKTHRGPIYTSRLRPVTPKRMARSRLLRPRRVRRRADAHARPDHGASQRCRHVRRGERVASRR